MKHCKRLVCWLTCLVAVASLMLCAPAEAEAASTASPTIVLCASLDSDREILSSGPGIPIAISRTSFMLTGSGAGLHSSQAAYYVSLLGEDGAVMEYSETFCGMDVFTLPDDVSSSLCFQAAAPCLGQTVELLCMNQDGDVVSYDTTITGSSQEDNDSGMYELDIDFTKFSNLVAPGALLDSDGYLVGVVVNDGGTKVYAFAPAEDAESTTPRETSPSGNKKSDDDEEDAATPTRARKEDDTQSTDEPEDKESGSSGILLIVAGVLVILVAVFVLLRKKKTSKSAADKPNVPGANAYSAVPDYPVTQPVGQDYGRTQPVQQDYPVTRPVQPDHTGTAVSPRPHMAGWEDATADDPGTGLFAVCVSGALQGRQFPISQRGIVIGRGETADVRYPADARGVSRQHCKVFWKNGVLMLVDLGSTSGTLLRGQGPLTANVPVPVVEGDIFYIGSKENALTIRLK